MSGSSFKRAIQGAVVGFFIGGPVGAFYGFQAGLAVGTVEGFLVDPSLPNSATNKTKQGSKAYQTSIRQNEAALGDPIPVIYGTVRYFPPLAGSFYQIYEGNSQYIYGILCLGQGDIDAIRVWIGESNVSELESVEYQVFKPEDHGSALGNIEGFWPDMYEHVYVSPEGAIDTDNENDITYGPYVVCPVGRTVKEIHLDLQFPAGLGRVGGTGSISERTLIVSAVCTPIDDAGEQVGTPENYSVSYTDKTRNELLKTWKIPIATTNRYKVELSRDFLSTDWQDLNKLRFASLKGIIYHPDGTYAYGNVTLMAVQIKATESIGTGGSKAISVQVTSSIPRLEDGALEGSSNPADIFADILLNTTYGARLLEKHINRTDLLTHKSNWADANGFNGIFDSHGTVAEALSAVLLPVRARPVNEGVVFNVVQDGPKEPEWIFSPANIVEGSFTVSFSFSSERDMDGYQVEYRPPLSVDPAYSVYPDDAVRPKAVTLFGCTDEDTAYRYAKLLWNQRVYGRKICSFTTEMEGNLPRPGDIARISHYVMSTWGHAGEVTKIQGRVVTLDISVDWLLSEVWKVYLRDEQGRMSQAQDIEPIDDHSFELVVEPPFPIWTTSSDQVATIVLLNGVKTESALFQITDVNPVDNQQSAIRASIYDDRIYQDSLEIRSWSKPANSSALIPMD